MSYTLEQMEAQPPVEGEVVDACSTPKDDDEDDNDYWDDALELLESCTKLLAVLADERLTPKLTKGDRGRMLKMARECKEFTSQWDYEEDE